MPRGQEVKRKSDEFIIFKRQQ